MTVFVEVQRGVGGLGAAATPGVGGVAVARKTAWCSRFSRKMEEMAAQSSAAVASRWWTSPKISGLMRL